MSILIKIRNILYILRIFYWLAFKAVVKAYWRGSVHLYTFHLLQRPGNLVQIIGGLVQNKDIQMQGLKRCKER